MLTYLKQIKLHLQFTGWLQYILSLVIASLFLLLSLPFLIFNVSEVAIILQAFSLVLLAITFFDVLTLKYNLRPKESLPKRLDNLDAFDLMRARVACRSFQDRLLTSADHIELMNVVQNFTGSKADNFGTNSIRFEYIKAPLTVWPVVGAQEFLVAIVPKEYSRLSVLDVGRNLQKVVNYATKMGLATCWIGPGADQSSMIKHLGERFNQTNEHIICTCAIGYKSIFKPLVLRLMVLSQHKRLPISSLFFRNNMLTLPINEQDAVIKSLKRAFEVCQWAPSSFNAQPTRAVAISDADKLISMDFYTTTHSRYYAPVALGIWCANWELAAEALGITGHFEKKTMQISNNTAVYDMSWIVD